MRVVPTALPEVVIIESPVHGDDRGFFTEVFHSEKFKALGVPTDFAQDNHSRSTRNTLRGLHYQLEQPQGKLVRPVTGSIFDVAVDVRKSSSSFGKWVGVELTAGDGRQLWIPPGFAHGFLVLSEVADLTYKCTTVYNPASDRSLAWNDPMLNIAWPIPNGQEPLLSGKDESAPGLSAAEVYP